MVQDILPVTRAELQPAHEANDFGMEIVEAELERRGFAFLPDRLFHLRFDLFDDLLDTGGMDAAVGDQSRDRLARHLTAVRIERREDDRAGRIVHDQLDAGRLLERADVAPFTSDDPPLHVVARQIDDRHGSFDGVLGGAALNGVGDDLLGALAGGLARLRLEALHQVGGVAPRVRFDLLEKEIARLVGGQPRDALQLALTLGEHLVAAQRRRFALFLELGERAVTGAELALEAIRFRDAVGERARLFRQAVLEPDDLLVPRARLGLGLGHDRVRLLARLDLRFLLD
jgi:hypothetical protein